MSERDAEQRTRWAIVVGDDHGHEWAPSTVRIGDPSPVQYSRLGGAATLLQKALHRAARIAPASQILATARAQYRAHWEPALWFVSPGHRFISDDRWGSWLTTATALLRIACESPSSVVAILPARCFVLHEAILSAAIDQGLALLPRIPEGVVTLGMADIDEAVDEDYLLPSKASAGPVKQLLGVTRGPVSWIARHLQQNGALVASEVILGYVGALSAHVSLNWPGLTSSLLRISSAAAAREQETKIPQSLQRAVPSRVLRSLRWYPPSLAQRALRVQHCGWSSLRSARAVVRIGAFMSEDPRGRSAPQPDSRDQYSQTENSCDASV